MLEEKISSEEDALIISNPVIMLSKKQIVNQLFKRSTMIGLSRCYDSVAEMLKIHLISRAGPDQLAASGVMFATYHMAFVVRYILSASNGLVNRELGRLADDMLNLSEEEKNQIKLRVGEIHQQSRLAALLLSIPAMVVILNTKHILLSFGIKSHLAELAQNYAHYSAFSMPFMLWEVADTNFIYCINKEKSMSAFIFLDATMGVLFTALLVPGLFSRLPKLGTTGSGIAILLQSSLITTMLSIYLYRTPAVKDYRLYQPRISSSLKYLREILLLGVPLFFSLGISNAAEFIRNIIFGNLGQSELMISQVYSSCTDIVISCIKPFTIVGGVLTGQWAGQRNFRMMKQTGRISALLAATNTLVLCIPFVLASTQLAKLFLSDEFINKNESKILHLFSLAFITKFFFIYQSAFSENLKNVKDTLLPSIVSILSYILITLPLSLLAVKVLDMDMAGIEGASSLGYLFNSIFLACYWHSYSSRAQTNQRLPATSNQKAGGYFAHGGMKQTGQNFLTMSTATLSQSQT